MLVGADVVSCGDISSTVSFGMATKLDSSFQNMSADGIYGLGLSGLAVFTHPPAFEQAVNQVTSTAVVGWLVVLA